MKKLERLQLFDYLLIQCSHKEAIVGDTHWHVCHAGSGDSICVCNHKTEAMVIAYGLALYDRLSVSEQLQILGEATKADKATLEPISVDELMAYLRVGGNTLDGSN